MLVVAAAAAAVTMCAQPAPAGAKRDSVGVNFVTWPAIIIDGEGQRHWGMVQQVRGQTREHRGEL